MAVNKLKSLKKKTSGVKKAKAAAQSRPVVVPRISLPQVRTFAGGGKKVQGPPIPGSGRNDLGYDNPLPPIIGPLPPLPPMVGPPAPFNPLDRVGIPDYEDKSKPGYDPPGPYPDMSIQQIIDAINEWPGGHNDYITWGEDVGNIRFGLPPRPPNPFVISPYSPFAGDPDYEAWAAEEERKRRLRNTM